MQILHIMIGCPGSGKSTFIQKHMQPSEKWVSRDIIRFGLLKEGEDYFSHETEVFRTFARTVKNYLEQGLNVWADATHLTIKSRMKLLSAIGINYLSNNDIKIYYHIIRTNLNNCIKQNENRKGTKSYVPTTVIKRMYSQIEYPDSDIEPFSEVIIERSDN